MSYQIGVIRWPDATLGYYWFQNTAGVAHPKVYGSLEELPENPREDPWETCNCELPDFVGVDIALDHEAWKGRACRRCKTLHSGLDPTAEGHPVRGKPSWWPAGLYDD